MGHDVAGYLDGLEARLHCRDAYVRFLERKLAANRQSAVDASAPGLAPAEAHPSDRGRLPPVDADAAGC